MIKNNSPLGSLEDRNDFIEKFVSKNGFSPLLYREKPLHCAFRPGISPKNTLEFASQVLIQSALKRGSFLVPGKESPIYLYDETALELEVAPLIREQKKLRNQHDQVKNDSEKAIIETSLKALTEKIAYFELLQSFPTVKTPTAGVVALKTGCLEDFVK